MAENDLMKKEAELKAAGIQLRNLPIRAHEKISMWHGITETAVYVTAITLRKPEGIAVWLGFKAVMRWKVSEEPDLRHVSGSLIYMIGTALNLGFGILGGLIATRQAHL